MAQKLFVVRAGFIFTQRIVGEKGDVKIKEYSEGDTLKLDPLVDDIPHQLELADEKDRIAAAKAEDEARKAAAPAAVPAAFDQEALAAAIAAGVAQALAAQAKPAA